MIINFSNLGGGGGSYTLPVASENTLGGVKIGSGITIDAEGHISAEGGSDPELREDIIEGRVVAGMAKQLQSPDGVSATGSPYVMRTTAGDASVSTGFANLNGVLANTIADEPVFESINGEYNAIPRGQANNEIWYTTTDGSALTPYSTTGFGANIISNTYEDGKGIITFDGTVTEIDGAFKNCATLASISLPETTLSIKNSAFFSCTNLTAITIPSSVTGITGNNPISYCSNLRYLEIPSSVTTLGNLTFRSSLIHNDDEIYFYSVVPPTGGTNFFYATDCVIYVPAESVDAYKSADGWSDYASRIQAIPETNDLTASNDDSEDIPTMSIDVATFREAVSETSGTYTFNYDGTSWSPAIADYGITVEGDVVEGDSISVVYVAAVTPSPMRNATPTAFYATGLNSFDKGGEFSTILEGKSINAEGQIVDEEGSYVAFVKAVKNLEDGYIVYGDTGVIGLADSYDVETVEVVEDNDGVVMADKDYIAITTYDLDTLCVHPRWSGYKDTDYEEFRIAKFVIPSTDKDGNDLPVCVAVGNTRNEYDFAGLKYIQRVEVVPFDEELIEQLRLTKIWGVDYVFDENNIHMVLDTPVVYDLAAEDNLYWADDFGVEGFEGTEVGAVSHTWYMANLVDKLRRDVVTKDELNIDRLNAVDELPENPENGQVFALKTPIMAESDFFSWDNTGKTSNYTITINHLPNDYQTIGSWKYYGGHPRLDWDGENGNFIFKTKYSGETAEVYDTIATIEPGTSANSISFYSQSGSTGSLNSFSYNWTNSSALTIRFNASMDIYSPDALNKGKVISSRERLVRYNINPGEWGEWVSDGRTGSYHLGNHVLHYAAIPADLDGQEIIALSYFDQENNRLHFYFDLQNDAIQARKSGDTTNYYTIYRNGGPVTVNVPSMGDLTVTWLDGQINFHKEWTSIYSYCKNVISTSTSHAHYELLNNGAALAGNPSANTVYNSMKFPLWNDKGIIVGQAEKTASEQSVYLNNTGYSNSMVFLKTGGSLPTRLWIPSQGGNQGQVLTSTGGNEPSWVNPNTITGGISFWRGTSDEYDAIATKDPNTFYIIVDE